MSTPSGHRTAGHELALAQLRRIEAVSGALRVAAVREPSAEHETLAVDISVDCAGMQTVPLGLQLRRRELITLSIPGQFPFFVPAVTTRHRRFAGFPHVQWGNQLCLYRSVATEWYPADGMFGLITRLVDWLQAGARGELDTPGEPLHPPVAYQRADADLLVIRADAPQPCDGVPWLGVALARQVAAGRADVVGWLEFAAAWPTNQAEARAAAGIDDEDAELFVAPTVITTRPLPFEYPRTARDLVTALDEGDQLSARVVLALIGFASRTNRDLLPASKPTSGGPDSDEEPDTGSDGSKAPLVMLVGAPGRGIAGSAEMAPHLAGWSMPGFAATMGRLTLHQFSSRDELADLGREVLEMGKDWLDGASIRWARINEARPQTTVRRDTQTPAMWLAGQHVLVLGAGALGAPAAEMCIRAGAAHVTVADKGLVHPGILVRQPYDDADIGSPKADVLAARLRRIHPDAGADSLVGDIANTVLDARAPLYDLVIDATADRVVRSLLEQRRAGERHAWPPVITLMIGHRATNGIAALSPRGASGAGMDILRRLALAAHTDTTGTMSDIAEDFFPATARTALFQPEPGCSDATFTGSAFDVTGLVGQLLTGMLHALQRPASEQTMTALVARMPTFTIAAAPQTGPQWLSWPNDIVIDDHTAGYQIRISLNAMNEMRTEARRGARLRGPRVETGGTLLGAIDDAARVIWIDEATGPPPDSLLSELHFQHGTAGVSAHLTARRKATSHRSGFLGMWHTHPHGPASPSPTDEAGMASLVLPVHDGPPRALILIAAGPAPTWQDWLNGVGTPHWYARLVERQLTPSPQAPHESPRSPETLRHLQQLTWWPGGYAAHPLSPPTPTHPAQTRRTP
ncbi:ThiF family adenylyltransferase [Kitasatospora indigofera]|uniref:ThiF family adenylyltransferase n=1 Tax=Kitasatospora indigofera TaxID=67307 RepID=UPI0033BB0698